MTIVRVGPSGFHANPAEQQPQAQQVRANAKGRKQMRNRHGKYGVEEIAAWNMCRSGRPPSAELNTSPAWLVQYPMTASVPCLAMFLQEYLQYYCIYF
jgi:hypothetical protein